MPQPRQLFDNTTQEGTFTTGSGYQVNDIITLENDSLVRVEGATAGAVSQFNLFDIGPNPAFNKDTLQQKSTDGNGTGFSLTFRGSNVLIHSVRIVDQGSYTVLPSNPVTYSSTTGAGNAASFTITESSLVTEDFVRKLSNKNLRLHEENSQRIAWDSESRCC